MNTPAKVVLVLTFLLALASTYFWTRNAPPEANGPKRNANIRVGLLLGTLREERWQKDRDLFVANIEQAGGFVTVESANSDADTQYQQAEKLLIQGIKTLVIVPHDGKKASAIVDLAHKNGAKVIAYDRLITDSPVDFYVSFDNEKVGALQATGVLSKVTNGNIAYIGGAPTDNNATLLKTGSRRIIDPRIESGDIKLVVDEFTPDWRPDDAYATLKRYLQTGKKLDGVIAANDGTAYGAIRALSEFGFAGKIPVSGQDAELSACQRIIAGTQTMTVYKPIQSIAKKAAELAVTMSEGKVPEKNSTVRNGTYDVPSFLIEPVSIDATNMDATIIKDGYHTREQVYGS